MNERNQAVAVTGAGGFLGRALVPALAADPDVGRVVAIDLHPGSAGDVEWVAADVRDPRIEDALRGVDVVVHLAAIVLGDIRLSDSVNVGGTANVCDAAGRAGVRRMVLASSVAAYGFGTPGRLLTEEDPLRPIDAFTYSRTKGAAERAADQALQRHPDLKDIRLRPSIILGPNTHEFASALAGRLMIRPGFGAGSTQFVHVDDVVEAFRLAIVTDATGAFNIAAADTVTYRELATIIGAPLVTVPAPLARFGARMIKRFRPTYGIDPGWVLIAQQPPLVSVEKADRVLGWRAKRSSRETIEEFVRVIRAEAHSKKRRRAR